MRSRRLLVAAIVAAVAIVVAGWLLQPDRGDQPRETGPTAPPPTAAPAGFRWVGSGHVVVAVPEEWDADTSGCEEPPCKGGEGQPVSTVNVGFTPEDEVSPQDKTVVIDGTSAIRSPIVCDDSGCTGRILVPDEHAVVVVKGSDKEEVADLLDGVHVLDDRVAVPETRFADQPAATDARRFREWAESLGLKVTYRELPGGDIRGQVIAVEPPTGTVVTPGSTVVAEVVGPAPAEPPCRDLRVIVRTPDAGARQVYPATEPIRVSLAPGKKLPWRALGACASSVRLDDSDPTVLTWLVPLCSGLDEQARSSCVAGQARLGSVVVTRSG